MKILYELQLSSVNKKSGKIMMDSDSNFAFALNLLKELKNYATIFILIPLSSQIEDNNEAVGILKKYNLKPYELKFIPHPAESRFFVSIEDYKEALNHISPDIIFCNDPTHVANWKQLCEDNIKIVTYNHWICFLEYPKNKVPYFFRQVEGEYLADLVFCNSSTQLLALMYQTRFIPNINYSKFKILYPPVDEETVKRFQNNNKFERNLILFNHRLSSQIEYAENFQNFMKIIYKIKKSHPDLEVWFTNPTGYIFERSEPWMRFKTLNREEYVSLLSCKPLTCAFFEKERMWSMSLSEANAFGGVSVVPYHSCFVEMYPNNYNFFFRNNNLDEAAEKIITLLKDVELRIREGEKLQRFVLANFSNKIIAKKVYKMLSNLLNGR